MCTQVLFAFKPYILINYFRKVANLKMFLEFFTSLFAVYERKRVMCCVFSSFNSPLSFSRRRETNG